MFGEHLCVSSQCRNDVSALARLVRAWRDEQVDEGSRNEGLVVVEPAHPSFEIELK